MRETIPAPEELRLDRDRLADWLSNQEIPRSRLARAFAHPVKNAIIGALRMIGRHHRFAPQLFWGDRLHGFVPEAVTSLVWKYRFYEQATSLFILRHLKPGDVFVDIGAHYGYFTLLAARLVGPKGRVVSIEAIASTCAQLERNVVENGIGNTEIHNVAAFSERRLLIFKDYGPTLSSLNTAFAARGGLEGACVAATEIEVQAVPADQIISTTAAGALSIIKIDAESSEEYVLAGLSRTIDLHRPTLIVELSGAKADKEGRTQRIMEALDSLGYNAFILRHTGLGQVPQNRPLDDNNVVFIHRDQRSRFALDNYAETVL
jgi:FkbM family methyltransferase